MGSASCRGQGMVVEVADRQGSAYALYNLGNVAYTRGECSRGVAFLEESLALAREVADVKSVAACLNLSEIALLAIPTG